LNLENSNWSSSALLEFLAADFVWPEEIDAPLLAQFIRVVPENGPLYDWIETCQNQNTYYQWQKSRASVIDEQTLFNVEKFEKIESNLLFIQEVWQTLRLKEGSVIDWLDVIRTLFKRFNFNQTMFNRINELSELDANFNYRAWLMMENYLNTVRKIKKVNVYKKPFFTKNRQ
jgi:hypothetical protein